MNHRSGLRRALFSLVAGLGMCSAASAAMAASPPCSAPDSTAVITNCYFDLTHLSGASGLTSEALNGGLFRLPGEGDSTQYETLQPFVRIQMSGAGGASHAPSSNANSGGGDTQGSWNRPIRLGDIPKVTVCDGGGSTGTNCTQYYEFVLNVTTPGSGSIAGLSLDEFKLYVTGRSEVQAVTGTAVAREARQQSNGHRTPRAALRVQSPRGAGDLPLSGTTLVYDMDAATGGDASVLLNYSANGAELQALIPVSNFNGASSDSQVYLQSRLDWSSGQCPTPCKAPEAPGVGRLDSASGGGFAEWSIRRTTGLTPTAPASPTALLLALGLAGLVTVRAAGAGRSSAPRA